MSVLIEMKNMYKIYEMGTEKVHALDGVNLKINKGEYVAIVGPSGSGKSTLMNMIGCLDVPTSGEYLLVGQDISKMSDRELTMIRRRKIGFIFQQFNLLKKSTALENVELPAMYNGNDSKERKKLALAALEAVGLGDRTKHRPTELSGGQQQRVAIARALVNDPPVILADEPTGNLDSKSGEDIMEMIENLHGKGNTIILITHDKDIAEHATRVINILDGRITSDKYSEKQRKGVAK
ncbi:MAG: ABC transporter ATP-binding protein [Clostridia bacterium]|nr:ABC transporter ATP-binding protein [Clostridia bacterium]